MSSPSLVPRRRNILLALLGAASSTLIPLGCSQQQASFKSMDVTGASWGQAYALPDLDGREITQASFPGKVAAVFFGFLYCPDFCPAHLNKMVAVKQALGDDGKDFEVLFITVDPERDRPEMLKPFVASFDPSFIGLRGTQEQVDALAKDFRVYFKKVDTAATKTDPTAYTIDHTTFTYLFDGTGALRLVVPHDLPIDELASDIRLLLAETRA